MYIWYHSKQILQGSDLCPCTFVPGAHLRWVFRRRSQCVQSHQSRQSPIGGSGYHLYGGVWACDGYQYWQWLRVFSWVKSIHVIYIGLQFVCVWFVEKYLVEFFILTFSLRLSIWLILNCAEGIFFLPLCYMLQFVGPFKLRNIKEITSTSGRMYRSSLCSKCKSNDKSESLLNSYNASFSLYAYIFNIWHATSIYGHHFCAVIESMKHVCRFICLYFVCLKKLGCHSSKDNSPLLVGGGTGRVIFTGATVFQYDETFPPLWMAVDHHQGYLANHGFTSWSNIYIYTL